jgi:sortase A
MTRRQGLSLLIIICITGGSLFFCSSIWIHAKGMLAQILLRQAWEKTLTQGKIVKPWPWADTWPVARLRVPEYEQDLIVLAGQAGATLAFGPGMLSGGSKPGQPGTCILAGHRDTDFSFLQEIQSGDIFVLEDSNSKQWKYKVSSTSIRPAENLYLEQLPISRLALITCYPFAAIRPGTPQRYVILAEKI